MQEYTLELFGKRKDMLGEIEKNPQAVRVRVRTKPSKAIFFHLLQKTKTERVIMTPGIFATVPKKVLDALSESGITIEVIEKRAGRPAKFPAEKRLEALRMLGEGKSARKISERLQISQTAIYAWKRRAKRKEEVLPDST